VLSYTCCWIKDYQNNVVILKLSLMVKTAEVSGPRCYTAVKDGPSARLWKLAYRQQKCGFYVEWWRFHGWTRCQWWSATPSQHRQTTDADNRHQATPFSYWTCYKKRKAGIPDADWENRGQKSTGSPTFDISRLVGTIYWHKPAGPYHKVAKMTRERCCGCRQCHDSDMTLGLDWNEMVRLYAHSIEQCIKTAALVEVQFNYADCERCGSIQRETQRAVTQ